MIYLRRSLLALLAITTVATLPRAAQAAPNIVSVEIAIEASTDMTTLPLTDTGTVVLACATCKARTYHVTPQTTYFVGSEAVTLVQLNAFAAANRSHAMSIFVKPDESAVTRIVVAGQLSSGKRK
jgi:hypothetical protein